MAEFEFGGVTFRGGKMFAILTALSTLGGGAWGAFEFYADYMDMKEIVQNIDIGEIQSANQLQLQKLEDAISYTQDIKDDLKGDVSRLEALIGTLENRVVEVENKSRELRSTVYTKLDTFEERMRLTLKENQDMMASMRDNINTQLETSENRIKDTQSSIEDTLESVRDEMNQVQKDVTSSIREVEDTIRESEKDVRDTMRNTESRLEDDMRTLEKELSEKLQEALDNPLSN